MKATQQSLGPHTPNKAGHKILEVGREEGPLVRLPLVVRLSAKQIWASANKFFHFGAK
jgi:hypothetical protein